MFFGLYEVTRYRSGDVARLGIEDLPGDHEAFDFSTRQVRRLVTRRWCRPPTPQRAVVLMTDASDTGAGVVVTHPGARLEHTCARFGGHHNQDDSSSTERELVGGP